MSLLPYQSIPQMVRDLFCAPGTSNLNHHRDGRWHCYTPSTFVDDWRSLSLALREIGIHSNQGVGIMAPSSPEWIMSDLAVQTCKAWTVPLFPNLSSENFKFQCEDSAVKVLFIDDPSQLTAELKPLVQNIPVVVCFRNHHGLAKSISLQDLLNRGKLLRQDQGDSWSDQQIDGITRNDIATIIYTSGSTGFPKGVEVTHGNLIFQFESARDLYDLQANRDIALSILPVAHIFERMCIYFFISLGLPVWFGSDPKAVGEYLREIKPTVLPLVPRILERVYERLTSSAQSARGPRKLILMAAIRYARRADPFKKGLQWKIWNTLVYSKMRAALGGSLRLVISGSSALNPAVHRFLLNLDLPIYEGYGLTESGPTLSAGNAQKIKIGSVGPAFPGVELRIGDQQEIQARSPGVMKGYHNNPQATTEAFTADGWLKTGDSGRLDEEGFLFITGRLKELFKTSTGKYVSPVPIEIAITRDPFIEAAVIVAENRKFVSALLFLNHVQCNALLRKGDTYNPMMAVSSKRIIARVRRQIERVNAGLSEWEKVRQWILLPDTLTPESGMLTPTLKIRRKHIEQQFNGAINSIYGKEISVEE